MKHLLLLTIALLIGCLSFSQVDSFRREGIMFYSFDARNKPVRNFYRQGYRICPFCNSMETYKHIDDLKLINFGRANIPDDSVRYYDEHDTINGSIPFFLRYRNINKP